MAFDWLKAEWVSWLSIFTVKGGIPAAIWSYGVALFLIVYPLAKVSFFFFARAKSKQLLSYYNSLLKENEIDLLVGYIQKYHIRYIKKYLQGKSHLPEDENFDFFRTEKSEAERMHDKLIKPKQMYYAAIVYWNILANEDFVRAAATKYPDLFAEAFIGMETKYGANRDLVMLFLQCLFEENSQALTKELKKATDSHDSILERSKNIDLPILSGLFIHTAAAYENYVWYPVGEGAMKSLKHDDAQKEFLLKAYDSDLDNELWKYKIWVAIIYFEYMVRETIYRYNGWHMWLHYFTSTTELIIENIPADEDDDERIPVYSFNHHILKKQFEVMFDWLHLTVDENKESQVIDTIVCLGKCIDTVCRTSGSKIRSEFKIDLVDSLITICFKNIGREDNAASVLIVEWLSKFFLNPGKIGRAHV